VGGDYTKNPGFIDLWLNNDNYFIYLFFAVLGFELRTYTTSPFLW
jgi:hypothetical protein